jgi:hypothetical protein
MHSLNPIVYASDLRYALEVLDEYKHLGLDEEHVSKLRRILKRQIKCTEELVSCGPSQPIQVPDEPEGE